MAEDGNNLERPCIAQVSILFSITIALFLLIGYRVQQNEFYSGILITEFGLIMLPALIYLIVFRYDLRHVLRLNKASFLNFFVVFWLMAFAIPLAGFFNFINLWIVDFIFGKIIVKQPPIAQDVPGLILNILVIGASAGICEEFLFRGVIQRGFERLGAARAILITAFLFSLTHQDFQKILGTFVLGALIGFIVYRTNSLYCGMFAHFTNNALAVLLSFAALKITEIMKGAGVSFKQSSDLNALFSTLSSLPSEQLVIVLFIYGFMFLMFLSVFIALFFAFLKLNPSPAFCRTQPRSRSVSGNKAGLLWLMPGISLIVMIYFAEVMNFRGISSGFAVVLRRLLGAL